AVSGGFFGAGVFFVESGQAPGQLPNETIFEPLATAQSVKTLDEESVRFRRASQIDQALRSIDSHTEHVYVILIEMLPHDVVRLPRKRLGPGHLALLVETAGQPRRRDADTVLIAPVTVWRDAGRLPLGTLRVVEPALLAEEARVRIERDGDTRVPLAVQFSIHLDGLEKRGFGVLQFAEISQDRAQQREVVGDVWMLAAEHLAIDGERLANERLGFGVASGIPHDRGQIVQGDGDAGMPITVVRSPHLQ